MILCHSRLTLHLEKAHAAIVIITPPLHILFSVVYHWFPMFSIQSLLSFVHASCRQRYFPKWKVLILLCISLALHTFSCIIWACDLAKTCTCHPPIPRRRGLILLHQYNLSNSGVQVLTMLPNSPFSLHHLSASFVDGTDCCYLGGLVGPLHLAQH